jgi:hypothetical protein
MGLKGEVMELLRQKDAEGLERLVAVNPRAVRPLVGRLWDVDADMRRLAAQALGEAAARHPDLGRELLRRLLWALNDESATNGKYALPAIGEIGRRSPRIAAPFIGPMVSYMWDDNLRLGILRALCRIAETSPEVLEGVRDRLLNVQSTEDPEERVCLDRLLDFEKGGMNAC